MAATTGLGHATDTLPVVLRHMTLILARHALCCRTCCSWCWVGGARRREVCSQVGGSLLFRTYPSVPTLHYLHPLQYLLYSPVPTLLSTTYSLAFYFSVATAHSNAYSSVPCLSYQSAATVVLLWCCISYSEGLPEGGGVDDLLTMYQSHSLNYQYII